MYLFRSMKEAHDGLPEVGGSARLLGVRRGNHATPEVLAVNPTDVVGPGMGGMSVAPADPMHLDRHRRPRSLGGTGREPVWCIESGKLNIALLFRQTSSRHGLIEPSSTMTLAEFEDALAATRMLWALHCR
jgi:hypothetical protein